MLRRTHPRLAWQIVDGEAILVDAQAGTTIGLNPVGAFIWSRLDTDTEEAIAEEMSAAFDVDRERAKADLASFLESLRERQLLVE
jgi:hypothetical protein